MRIYLREARLKYKCTWMYICWYYFRDMIVLASIASVFKLWRYIVYVLNFLCIPYAIYNDDNLMTCASKLKIVRGVPGEPMIVLIVIPWSP